MERKLTYKQIGKAIRFFRKMRRETHQTMALKLNYKSHSSYAKIERGDVESIDIARLIDIAECLRVSIFTLLVYAEININNNSQYLPSLNDMMHNMKDSTDNELIKLKNLFPVLS